MVSGTAALGTTATAASPVGTYTITVAQGTLAATNYDFTTFTPGTLTVGKAHLTVTADAKSKTYGDANPAFTDTISGFVNGDTSGVVSGIAALNTTATAASPVGTYSITVAQGTLTATNYDFATFTPGTLTVGKAHLTVTADAKSKTYGDANPAFTATISGFVNGDTSSVVGGIAALNTTATAASPVGTYSITVAQGTLTATNYDFTTFTPGTLTVGKAHLTVTADAKSKTYGDANPAFTATISGFVNGDTSGVVSGIAALSTTATAASPVGTYSITVAQGTLTATNYDFATFTPGTLTVGKAHLTVTADAKSKTYGDANPAFTDTISGFVNGDTSGVVGGIAALNTTATAASPVGTYTITVAQGTLTATNYDFATFTPGTLTIVAQTTLTQTVSGTASSLSVLAGHGFSVGVQYTTSDNDNTLTGLGLRIHYNSSLLTFNGLSNVLQAGFIQQSGPIDDTADYDHDPATDKYVLVSWADINGKWPNQALPVSLLTSEFHSGTGRGGRNPDHHSIHRFFHCRRLQLPEPINHGDRSDRQS